MAATTIKTFKRWEKKYMVDSFRYERLLPILAQHMTPDPHCQDGHCYTIYNVYYDTDNNDVIRNSLSKPYYKEKLRMRSYRLPVEPEDPVFLELKKKIGGIVSKRRVTLPLHAAEEFVRTGEKPAVNTFIDQEVVEEIACFLRRYPVKPALFLSYDRLAFFDREDPEFRITFDHNILTRRSCITLSSADFGAELLSDDVYLMEVKFIGAMPLWLTHALSELGLYSTGFSKYGTEYQQYRTRMLHTSLHAQGGKQHA